MNRYTVSKSLRIRPGFQTFIKDPDPGINLVFRIKVANQIRIWNRMKIKWNLFLTMEVFELNSGNRIAELTKKSAIL